MRSMLRTALLAAAFAVATIALGWWSPALVGAAWGVLAPPREPAARQAAVGATFGWAALLGWTAAQAPMGALLRRLGNITQAPPVALIGVTLLLGLVLAWSAAVVARGVASGFERLPDHEG